MCHKNGKPCAGQCDKKQQQNCQSGNPVSPLHIVSAGSQWLKPTTLDALCKLLAQHRNDNYRLVFGNTGFGEEIKKNLLKFI